MSRNIALRAPNFKPHRVGGLPVTDCPSVALAGGVHLSLLRITQGHISELLFSGGCARPSRWARPLRRLIPSAWHVGEQTTGVSRPGRPISSPILTVTPAIGRLHLETLGAFSVSREIPNRVLHDPSKERLRMELSNTFLPQGSEFSSALWRTRRVSWTREPGTAGDPGSVLQGDTMNGRAR